jgi:signal transduction histidine kinase/CheY-like chemotaxis protein
MVVDRADPEGLSERVGAIVRQQLRPVTIVVDAAWHVRFCEGDLAHYGLQGVSPGEALIDRLPVLVGLEAGVQDSGVELPLVGIHDTTAHLRVFPFDTGYAVLLLSAETEAQRQRQQQQVANENRLLRERQSKLMTELDQARRLAEDASLLKSRFIAGMSHEFRTPLASILGYLRLLRRNFGGRRTVPEQIDSMERNAQHLLGLINNVLDQARLEAGEFELQLEPINLPELLADVVDILAPLAEPGELDLQLLVGLDLPQWVLADATRLRQILLNLVGNAVKYTGAGEVTLRGSVRHGDVVLTVQDTGPGISPESQKLIFEPFRRERSHERRKAGVGLGLSITRSLVEQMSGEIELESELGVGSVFRVRLPLQACSPPAGFDVPERDAGEERLPAKVLVAEDNEDIRELMVLYLREAGYDPLVAADGQEAVSCALDQLPDIVLMDIDMPILDGHAAIRTLRQAGFRRPILAFTASASDEEARKARENGCDGVFTKPVDFDRLVRRLSEFTR